jgi:hypothetical protein
MKNIKDDRTDSPKTKLVVQERARLKKFLPAAIYFEYEAQMGVDWASEEQERQSTINTQKWLLCQAYEVVSSERKVRDLGLKDISQLNAFHFNFWLADIAKNSYKIESLDGLSTENSQKFKIVGYEQKISNEESFVISDLIIEFQEPDLEKAFDIQQRSRESKGLGLIKWCLMNIFLINGANITEQELQEAYDYKLVSLLATKINSFLEQSRRDATSFSLQNTPDGD